MPAVLWVQHDAGLHRTGALGVGSLAIARLAIVQPLHNVRCASAHRNSRGYGLRVTS